MLRISLDLCRNGGWGLPTRLDGNNTTEMKDFSKQSRLNNQLGISDKPWRMQRIWTSLYKSWMQVLRSINRRVGSLQYCIHTVTGILHGFDSDAALKWSFTLEKAEGCMLGPGGTNT